MAKVNRRITPLKKKERDYSVIRSMVRYVKLFVTGSLLIGLLGVVGFYGVQSVQNFLNRPITQIVINGNFDYVARSVVSQRVNNIIGDSFIGKNIHRIQSDLEEMPWVDSVNLLRQWPDKLIIDISEHAPIARWADDGFVNVRGELVLTENIEKLIGFPELNGEKTDVIYIMQEYSVLAKIFQKYDMKINYLEKNNRGAWKINLNNDWELMLGRGDTLQKVNRLAQLLDQQLLTKESDVDVVDIRYPNGIAVKWNAESELDDKASSASINRKKIELSRAQIKAHIRG